MPEVMNLYELAGISYTLIVNGVQWENKRSNRNKNSQTI